jgi:hypothetical protein
MAGGRALRQWFLYTTTTAPTGSDTVMILCAERHTGPDHRLPNWESTLFRLGVQERRNTSFDTARGSKR